MDVKSIQDEFGLPRSFGDGIILRWATTEDIDQLAEFNFQQHNDPPDDQPELWLKDWTRELMSGQHPTTKASDFTIAVCQSNQDKMISSAGLISQTWSYEGISFGLGRPEIIATEDQWRRKGLISAQMAVLHAKSKAKGELVQAITGIPWFYRQYGYEMALDLWSSRYLPFSKIPEAPKEESQPYSLRLATLKDQAQLEELYVAECQRSLISCIRDKNIWRYELAARDQFLVVHRRLFVIESSQGQIVGYADIPAIGHRILVRELVVFPGSPLRRIVLYLASVLKQQYLDDPGIWSKPIDEVTFALGGEHPAYEALAAEISPAKKGYAWYLRVNDLRRFLLRIGPVFQERLNDSVMASYSGRFKLNFYSQQLVMEFSEGRLAAVSSYEPESFADGDGFFPELTFLQILFGYRSFEELNYSFPDCYTSNDEARLLLNILFPKKHSQVIALT